MYRIAEDGRGKEDTPKGYTGADVYCLGTMLRAL